MTLGKIVKEARGRKSQTEMTVETGIPQSQLSAIENDRTMPSAARFIKLLRAAGVETLDLTQIELEMEDTDRTKGLYPAKPPTVALAKAA